MKNIGYAKFERERGGGGWGWLGVGGWGIRCIMGNVKWRIERCPVILGDKRAGGGGGGGENVIVISIPTQHLGVLTNSRLNVCAFQIELEFGNDTLGARERTNNNLNPHGWWGGP